MKTQIYHFNEDSKRVFLMEVDKDLSGCTALRLENEVYYELTCTKYFNSETNEIESSCTAFYRNPKFPKVIKAEKEAQEKKAKELEEKKFINRIKRIFK